MWLVASSKMLLMTHSKDSNSRPKIYEYNPNNDVTRWRYFDEDAEDYGWPFYGNIVEDESGKKFIKQVMWRTLTED